MKHSWKIRCLFVCTCLCLIICLGMVSISLKSSAGHTLKSYSLVINEAMVDNRNCIRDEDGDFEDWIELYNYGNSPINLKGFGLSNSSKQPFLWTFPDVIIKPKSFMVVWASEKDKGSTDKPVHTNFKLKKKDKAIILTAPDNGLADIFVFEPMGENISYGRIPDGSTKLYGFDEGTPGRANSGALLEDGPGTKRLEGPVFSKKGGIYKQGFDLLLGTNDSEAEIYYSLDGSVPSENSRHYNKPIPISPKPYKAVVVRARAYKRGYPKSEIITHSYFVDENMLSSYSIPIISLVTDPKNLFDNEKGIYVAGKIRDQWLLKNPNGKVDLFTPANYNQRGKNWERDGNLELIEPDGSVGLTQNVGIRISGAASASNKVKSFSIRASNDYDSREYFAYDFFNEKNGMNIVGKKNSKLSRILLRSSGNDSESSFMRDAFIQSLVSRATNLDIQRSRPCVLYINGDYYGIRNIREDYNKNYISHRYAMDEEDVVIVKNPTGVAGVEVQEGFVGDEMHYNHMIIYISKHDMENKHDYDYIKQYMDIDNFIEYNVLQIYSDNYDWPGNNVCVWRKRTQSYVPGTPHGHDGRWRWLIFDMDQSIGFYDREKAAANNSLERAVEVYGQAWPNPPWATLLLRSLLENEEFRNQFINTFADRLNSIFLPQTVLKNLDAFKEVYFPYVEMHIMRWNLHKGKVQNWLNEIEVMKNFAIERPIYMRKYIAEYFGLSGTSTIRVEMSKGGIVKVNSLYMESTDTPWEGIYFNGIPISIEAIPEPGFIFTGWEGINKMKESTLKIDPSQCSYLKAVFEYAE